MTLSLDIAGIFGKIIEHFTPHGTMELIGTVFGILCLIISCVNYVFTDRNKILIAKMGSDVTSGLNNFCYGKYVPMVICCISLVRETVFFYRGKKKWADGIHWMFIFMAAMVCIPLTVNFLTGDGGFQFMDLMPSVGSCLIVYGLFSQKTSVTKIFVFIGEIFYLYYYGWVGNVSQVIASIAPIISTVIGLVRGYNKRKKGTASGNAGA